MLADTRRGHGVPETQNDFEEPVFVVYRLSLLDSLGSPGFCFAVAGISTRSTIDNA